MRQSKSNLDTVMVEWLSKLDFLFCSKIFICLFTYFFASFFVTYTKTQLLEGYGYLTSEIYSRGLDWIPLGIAGFLYTKLLRDFNEAAISRLAIIFAYIGLIFAFKPASVRKIMEK